MARGTRKTKPDEVDPSKVELVRKSSRKKTVPLKLQSDEAAKIASEKNKGAKLPRQKSEDNKSPQVDVQSVNKKGNRPPKKGISTSINKSTTIEDAESTEVSKSATLKTTKRSRGSGKNENGSKTEMFQSSDDVEAGKAKGIGKRGKSSKNDSTVGKDLTEAVDKPVKKNSPRKRKLSNLKIVEELAISPVKKVRLEEVKGNSALSPQKSKVKNSPKKRVKSIARSALSPQKSKVKNSPKKRVKSIASSIAKNGVISQKNAPRKTLCNMDIMGLLDDDEDDEKEADNEDVRNNGISINGNQVDGDEEDHEVSFKVNVANKTSKVPVWRKQDTSKCVPGNDSNVGDVFDVDCYGEEEWGPEKGNKGAKKKVRRKKKDTKAILTFGMKINPDVRAAVKLTHNLHTPEGLKKKKPKKTNLKVKSREEIAKEDEKIAAIFNSPVKIVVSQPPQYESDASHGAHNYFDSVVHPPGDESNRSGMFGDSLQIPSKGYKTPVVPKRLKRLQDNNSSTPNNMKTSSTTSTQSVKEQLKNAFGFDSEEDLSECEETSMTISPVRKLTDVVPKDQARFVNRVSDVAIVSRVAATNSRPFRVNFHSGAGQGGSVAQQLLAQAKAIKENDSDAKGKQKRVSPRKKTVGRGPIHSSTLLDDLGDAPRQRSVKEMLEAASRKKTPAAENSVSESEISSLYEDLEQPEQAPEAPVETKQTDANADNKENANTNVTSPKKKFVKPAVTKVYKRKTVNNSTLTSSKQGASFDQSSKLHSPKKESKKDKQIAEWAKNQSAHFGEVEEFDLSFS